MIPIPIDNAPFKTYPGGKSSTGVYQAIINVVPPFINYCEPFVGNGLFRFLRPPSGKMVLCDLNPKVATTLQQWTQDNPKYRYDTQVFNLNGLEVMDDFDSEQTGKGNPTQNFIFCDPPYLFDTRKCQKLMYGEYEWNEDDHRHFLSRVKLFNCNIAITHYPCRLYDELLLEQGSFPFLKWHYTDFTGRTRHGTRTERIYHNYPAPKILHQYNHLGADYRARENIRDRIERFNNKLAQLPPVERNAHIYEIVNRYRHETKMHLETTANVYLSIHHKGSC
jgi:DNA adenine methylase